MIAPRTPLKAEPKVQLRRRITLAYTGMQTDDVVGSPAERNYYRVIPAGSTEKLFFKNREEYGRWRIREYTPYNPESHHDNERPEWPPEDGSFDAFEIWPVPLMG